MTADAMNPCVTRTSLDMALTMYDEWSYLSNDETYCTLVTPYGDKEVCQPWLRYLPVALGHQAIT